MGIGNHQLKKNDFTDEWLTPPALREMCGEFDLDPCSPINRPWDTAKRHIALPQNGLIADWNGRVWLNPPYGQKIGSWMRRMSEHQDGMSLVFARTETQWFHRYVFGAASGILFLEGRINFHFVTGEQSPKNAGAPSVLISYDAKPNGPNFDYLRIVQQNGYPGALFNLSTGSGVSTGLQQTTLAAAGMLV